MKISLDCSSQLELVEVVRTEESLGSVQGVFRTFFLSLLPSPRNVLLKSNDITQNTRNPSISFEMQTSNYNSSQFEPDKVFQATKSLGSVPTHFAIFLWSLLPSPRTVLLNSNEMPEIIAFPLIYKAASTARAKSNWSKLFELQGLIVVSQHSLKYFVGSFCQLREM